MPEIIKDIWISVISGLAGAGVITGIVQFLRNQSPILVFLLSSICFIALFTLSNWLARKQWERSEKYPERIAYRYNQEISKLKDEIKKYENILSDKRIERAKELAIKLEKYLSKRESVYDSLVKEQLAHYDKEKDLEKVNALLEYFIDKYGDAGIDLGHYRAALKANSLDLTGVKSNNLQWIGLERGYTAIHHQIYCATLLRYFEDYLDALDYTAHYKLLIGYVIPAKKDWIGHYQILHDEDRIINDVRNKSLRINRRIGQLLNGAESQ